MLKDAKDRELIELLRQEMHLKFGKKTCFFGSRFALSLSKISAFLDHLNVTCLFVLMVLPGESKEIALCSTEPNLKTKSLILQI